MTLSYEEIFEFFLGYITDYKLASMTMQDAYELMIENLFKAISKPYVRRLFSSFTNDRDVMSLTFEMEFPTDEDADKDFVVDVLAKGMVIEWLQPQVKNKLLTSQMFAGKEQKFYAQSNQLAELRGLLEDIQIEQRRLILDRGYINNPYLGGAS